MISFLAPWALAAGVLLAIPIILHLFKPRKVRRTPFSSLRWLHLSQQKLARRIKWHQVILFLLRFAFIALLVLAVAKPVLAPRGQTVAPVERFVVLDVSRSMGYQASGRASPIDLGKDVAAAIIKRATPDDRTAVMLTGSTTRLLSPPSRDPAIALAALKEVQAGGTDTNLSAALPVIRPMLARRRDDARVEIFFITDNHQRSWRAGEIASFVGGLDVPVHVRVVDVGVPAAQNAWIADARLITDASASARAIVRVQIGCVGDSGQSRTVRLGGLSGLPELTRTIEINPAALVQTDLELPAAFDPRGQVGRLSIEPGDALPQDDELFLNLDPPRATNVLLVEADSTRVESLRPGLYLRTALEALSTTEDRRLEVVSRTPANVTADDFARADVVLLAQVPSLSEPNVAALEARVKSGVGLAIFLGPDIDPTFYNTKFHRPLSPSESLLHAPLGAVAHASANRLDPLTNIEWSHPLLAPLHDPVLGDLAQTMFRSHYQIDVAAPGAQVLGRIDQRTPAILDRVVGSGKVILFNSTADDAWSDLPRRKSFVPLIDRLVEYLSGARALGGPRSVEVGQSATLAAPELNEGDSVTLVTPKGEKLTPAVQTVAGRTVIRLDALREPGVYRVESPRAGVATQNVVAQVGRGDSMLAPIDAATLKRWWEPAEMELLASDAVAQGVDGAARQRWALSPWLVALACAVFLAEMFLVHWLCPRMNPGVVAPVVPRSGMFSIKSEQPQELSV